MFIEEKVHVSICTTKPGAQRRADDYRPGEARDSWTEFDHDSVRETPIEPQVRASLLIYSAAAVSQSCAPFCDYNKTLNPCVDLTSALSILSAGVRYKW